MLSANLPPSQIFLKNITRILTFFANTLWYFFALCKLSLTVLQTKLCSIANQTMQILTKFQSYNLQHIDLIECGFLAPLLQTKITADGESSMPA
jgi:hypothetical protein